MKNVEKLKKKASNLGTILLQNLDFSSGTLNWAEVSTVLFEYVDWPLLGKKDFSWRLSFDNFDIFWQFQYIPVLFCRDFDFFDERQLSNSWEGAPAIHWSLIKIWYVQNTPLRNQNQPGSFGCPWQFCCQALLAISGHHNCRPGTFRIQQLFLLCRKGWKWVKGWRNGSKMTLTYLRNVIPHIDVWGFCF